MIIHQELSIGQVAKLAGVAASAIRYYEQVGLLSVAPRTSGQRRYDDRIFDQLNIIALLQDAGFTLAEMRTFLHDFPAGSAPSDRWRAMAERKLPQVEALMAGANEMKRILKEGIECRCPSLEECARRCLPRSGTQRDQRRHALNEETSNSFPNG